MRWWQPWALFVALEPGAAAMAQCQYEVQSWDPHRCPGGLPLPYSGAGLNDRGAWCGHRIMCWPGTGYEPVYCPPNGTPQVLAMPPGAGTDGAQAMALNNNGVVVGWYRVPPWNLDRACAWLPDGTVLDDLLPVAPADRSIANDVSDQGVIVGVHWTPGGPSISVPFIWHDGEVDFIDPAPFDLGQASMITESGFVMGYLGYPTLDARGFRWKDGSMEILEPLAANTSAFASGINESGVVVGSSRQDFGGSLGAVLTPTMWIGETPVALPKLPGYQSAHARRISDAGVIVGVASKPEQTGVPSQVPVLWIDGEVYALASLLIPGSSSMGTTLFLNDAGQILSSGGPKIATPLSSVPADLTGDCAVDGVDLGVLLASWGAPDFDPRCDFNGDGSVDGDDLGTLLGESSALK